MFARISRTSATLAIAVSSVLFLTAAVQAQPVRFVSSSGLDTNNCTRTAPCRNLQRGIDRTPVRGELQILDSGNYGDNAAIAKSITISAVGVAATVGAIFINKPSATVVLHGILLTGASLGFGSRGITVGAAAAVHIVGCQIERFSDAGITIHADNARVYISNTTVRGNGLHGVHIETTSSGARLTISNSRFENNANAGIFLNGTGGSQVTIEHSVLSGNGARGLFVGNGGIARISNSMVTDNGTGLEQSIGTLQSRGNNTVAGNNTDTSGAIDPINGI